MGLTTPEEEEKKGWQHFCKVLKLDEEARLVLEEHGIQSPNDWFDECRFVWDSGKKETPAFLGAIFEFDKQGKIQNRFKTRLTDAWLWMLEHSKEWNESNFCDVFPDAYNEGSDERKRKFLEPASKCDEEPEKKKPALVTKTSRMSASSFTSDSKHLLEGVCTLPPRPLAHTIPAHVQDLFIRLTEADRPDLLNQLKVFFQDRGNPYTLKSMGETTGTRSVHVAILDELVHAGVFKTHVTTEREFKDGLPIGDRTRTLKDLELVGGVATAGSPPDGYFHTKQFSQGELTGREVNFLVTGLIECKGSESSTLRGVGEVVAHASNAAVAMYKVGFPTDKIVIPILSLTGASFQFGAVHLLEECCPAFCCLTDELLVSKDMDTIAKYLGAMVDYTAQLEDYISGRKDSTAGPLAPREGTNMSLNPEKYFMKKMSRFFACYVEDPSKEMSLNHFLRITEKLHGFTGACLPLAVRLGETKSGTKLEDMIIFEMLIGYQMGFPDDEAERKLLMHAIRLVVNSIHQRGVVHMDLYLSNIMWSKVGNAYDVKLIDFDASQDKDENLKSKVIDRLMNKESDLFELYGHKAKVEYDLIYLDMFAKHLSDEGLRTARNQEERDDQVMLKQRLDDRCKALKEGFVAELKAKRNNESSA